MENSPFVSLTKKYFNRFSYQPAQLNQPVKKETELIVVIPCYKETELINSFHSLLKCLIPKGTKVEVITVINHSEIADNGIKKLNLNTYKEAENFAKSYNTDQIEFLIIKAFDLPKKHAGVGLARKIGMDEALQRFQSIDKDGVIVCYDADSNCEKNYFESILHHFSNPKTNGASIRFEHPIEGNEYKKEIYNAIIDYELHLRYYKNAVKFTGAPYGVHTIGSSMAVRASAYAKQGGMNKRKAGEDFYFLSKIIQLGNFTEINDTKVIPSPRVSDRVPFGTGKAVGDILTDSSSNYKTYSWEAFIDLKDFFSQVVTSYTSDNYEAIPSSIQHFISRDGYSKKINEIKNNTKTLATYRQRFFFVFDAFWVLKFVHFYRDNTKTNQLLNSESKKLLNTLNISSNEEDKNKDLLLAYRLLDSKEINL
jgi:cellulose synthase/poly-beta-1,6-N-acetylglucosamine synthase-like glycosyltransferase